MICRNFSGSLFLALPVMGLYSATVYGDLRTTGTISLPIVGWNAQLPLGVVFHWIPALVVSLLIAGVLGALAYRWIFYYLERHSPLIGTVAAMGLVLYVQALIQQLQRHGSDGYVEPLLPMNSLTVFGIFTTSDRVIMAVLGVGLVAGLWLLYQRSSFGLASRAVASNRWGAQLVGLYRERFGVLNWAIAFVLAGLVMILATPFIGRDPGTVLMLMIPALAATLVGKLQSLVWTLTGGLIIGGLQGVATSVNLDFGAVDLNQWVSPAALQQVVPVMFAAGAFLVFRRSLMRPDDNSSSSALSLNGQASSLTTFPQSTSLSRIAVSVAIGLLALSVVFLNSSVQFHRSILTTLIMGMLSLSIVAWSGSTGIPTAAPVAIAGVAAAVWTGVVGQGASTALAVILATGVAVVCGVGVALLSRWVRGMWYLVMTLLFVTVVSTVVLASPKVLQQRSSVSAQESSLLGLNIGAWDLETGRLRPAFVLIVGVVFIVACVVVVMLWRGRSGLEFRIFQGNERAAIAAGVNPWRIMLTASLVSSFVAATGGIAMALSVPSLSELSFIAPVALSVLVLTQLGGVTRVSSAMLAGCIAPAGVLSYLAESVAPQPFDSISLGVGGLGVVVLLVLRARRSGRQERMSFVFAAPSDAESALSLGQRVRESWFSSMAR